MEWYLKVVRDNYANFSGRARRKEFWMFYLFYFIVMIIAMMLDQALGLTFDAGYGVEMPYGWLYTLGALLHLLPFLGLHARRMHDVGKSGWFILISLVPLIGAIWLLILWCTDGSSEENKYGPSPKS
tara:strand:+ start:1113 stop:1493 length:381 start_codon:yes stop_codon:yes gene_type:complete